MSISSINDPKHWYDRAAKMRSLSQAINDIQTRATMLRLADDYDKLADSGRPARLRTFCEFRAALSRGPPMCFQKGATDKSREDSRFRSALGLRRGRFAFHGLVSMGVPKKKGPHTSP